MTDMAPKKWTFRTALREVDYYTKKYNTHMTKAAAFRRKATYAKTMKSSNKWNQKADEQRFLADGAREELGFAQDRLRNL